MNGAVQADFGSATDKTAPFASPDESITFDGATTSIDGYHFDITGSVTFSGVVAAAPEPSTWTLLFAGVGVVGIPLRRRWRLREIAVAG